MTFREFIDDIKFEPKFWMLLVLYSILTPLWAIAAYVTWHHDKFGSAVMWVLFVYCGINALFKWTDV